MITNKYAPKHAATPAPTPLKVVGIALFELAAAILDLGLSLL